ncbi:DeoR/GlpR family DNA-binding transcription regulator [Massilia endophytica]|uniref:DeoR/GlpR family DNA-binding transcription regulator n=1 Tax=Massilia endophytica TaxID=2899220 RepID=UPI001E35616A|nr:DeoR/GlpR family DNA-binding transcription regulator [Massilia endophytica]UGQ45767.1 DeoR/GlpR family DNA-binding transcription regulator [Massilia endophytica]
MTLPEERRRHILDTLEQEGRVLAAELATRFATSEDTIRRDLREMDVAGLLRRVHGGAVKRHGGPPSFSQREAAQQPRKAALGRTLCSLVRPGDVVLVDAGSTNLAMVRQLDDGHAQTIVTNSPPIAMALADFRLTQVVLLGGTLNGQLGAVLGSRTLDELSTMHADLCIVGMCGVEARRGLSSTHADEAVFKRAMLEHSGRRAAAILNERLEAPAPFHIAPLSHLDHLVLEHDVPAELLAGLRERQPGPECLLAEKVRP